MVITHYECFNVIVYQCVKWSLDILNARVIDSMQKNISTGPHLFRLENWRFEEWGDQVTVVSCDMRDWAAPEKADIIVSELLGSFGDNELSPECLDGAQHFLKGTFFVFFF